MCEHIAERSIPGNVRSIGYDKVQEHDTTWSPEGYTHCEGDYRDEEEVYHSVWLLYPCHPSHEYPGENHRDSTNHYRDDREIVHESGRLEDIDE